jgi:hypothetical protein
MKKEKRQQISDIAHSASEIQRLAVLMLTSDKVGRDWLIDMKHTHERLDLLIGRINGN